MEIRKNTHLLLLSVGFIILGILVFSNGALHGRLHRPSISEKTWMGYNSEW